MNHRIYLMAAGMLCLAMILGTPRAHAQVYRKTPAPTISVTDFFVKKGGQYTFSTHDLSPGADTVLHVNDYETGANIAWNDDCRARVGTGSQKSSCVTFKALADGRVKVFVRQYIRLWGISPRLSASPQLYSAVLTIEDGQAIPKSIAVQFTSGYLKEAKAGPYAYYTVEEQGGAPDTVLLLLNNTDGVVDFDDNGGVSLMSALDSGHTKFLESWPGYPWVVRLPTAEINWKLGENNGYLLVGSVGASLVTPVTTLVVQRSPVAGVNDKDGDGLTDDLETAIGTSRLEQDTDQDGIEDDVELLGLDADPLPQLLKFPYYGANPVEQDVFIEANWAVYDGNRPYQLLSSVAIQAAETMKAQTGVKLHFDNGIFNKIPATRTVYGAWGGAKGYPPPDYSQDTLCTWASPVRSGYFHFLQMVEPGGGLNGVANTPGFCFRSKQDAGVVLHELGHNLGLEHGGGDTINRKPNYPSVMNYANRGIFPDIEYSTGLSVSSPLLPFAVDESQGLGTLNSRALDYIGPDYSFGFDVDRATGSVDWNRNGIIDTGSVMAHLQGWADGLTQGNANYTLSSAEAHAALAWLTTERMYSFHQRPDGIINFRLRYQGAWMSPLNLAASAVAGDGPAAAHYKQDGQDRLLVAYTTVQGKLVYHVLTEAPGWTVLDNTLGWTGPMTLADAGMTGKPAVVHDPVAGVVMVYASKLDGTLLAWRLNLSTGLFGAPTVQTLDGARFDALEGVAVTFGYLKTPMPVPVLFLAALDPDQGIIRIATGSSSTANWAMRPLSKWWGRGGMPDSLQVPALAYVPYSPSQVESGRLYLAWTLRERGGVFIAHSMGCMDTSTGEAPEALFWKTTPIAMTTWPVSGSIALTYDLEIGGNLRASLIEVKTMSSQVFVERHVPFADGAYADLFTDYDDVSHIKRNINNCVGRDACATTFN